MTTLRRVQQLMTRRFGLAENQLSPGQPLRDLGLDSLAVTEFMFALEEEFAIRIPYGETEVHTVGDIAAAVERLARARRAKIAG